MRVCHLDTCPVGVATQNPELRARFSGKPEFVVNFFEFLAQEVRELLAELGFRSLEEAIGHRELLDVDRAVEHWKADGLDLSPILVGPEFKDDEPRTNQRQQEHELEKHFDQQLIRLAADALRERHADRAVAADPQHRTRRGHDARSRGHGSARRARSSRRARSTSR